MSDAPRLTRVLIEGLFDPNLPSIDIQLRLDDRVTILHGRNGSGKTRTLALLAALQSGSLDEIRQAPFTRLLVELSDGSGVEFVAEPREPGVAFREQSVRYVARGSEKTVAEGRLQPEDGLSDVVRARAESYGLRRVGPDAWSDPDRPRERYSSKDLAILLGMSAPGTSRGHDDLVEFCARLPSVKFIRADRLRAKSPARRLGRDTRRKLIKHDLTVERLSEVIRQQVHEADQEYRLESTQLDSALRDRLLEMPTAEDLPTLDELRQRDIDLAKEQERLSRLGLLRDEPSPIRPDAFVEGNRRMLTLLLDDGAQKIKPFRQLADKAQQLVDTLNRKLAPKVVRLDVRTGYQVTSGSGQDLPLSALSSGEQHELVLLHELLFEAEPNTLVLIDEPELSLHPTWQEDFLPDLLEIAQLSDLDFILATHSPYIIGDRTDLMVRLGEPFDERP